MCQVAVELAREGAEHVRRRRPEVFGTVADRFQTAGTAPTTVQAKSSPTDPVTVVDTETERLIRDRLARRRPQDSILGEEGGGTAGDANRVRWVIDPIDGTVNFLYGIPAFAVSVAAQIDGRSVAGAVVDVAREVMYCAAAGHGAAVIGADGTVTPLRCNDVSELSMALVATGFGYGSSRRARQGRLVGELLPQVRDIRRIGSAALDLCMVGAGLVDAHFEHGLSPWDWAAGGLIAQEAGARVWLPSPDSVSAAGAVVVACAPGVAAELADVFERLGAFEPIPE
ncbi:inositol monophosphatase [Skermania sp. ID1734]|nr:inositol monophosphatase [Skermania sp. ID1734]